MKIKQWNTSYIHRKIAPCILLPVRIIKPHNLCSSIRKDLKQHFTSRFPVWATVRLAWTFKKTISFSRSPWRSQYERIIKNIQDDSKTEVTLTLAICIYMYIMYIEICMGERRGGGREEEEREGERILKSN